MFSPGNQPSWIAWRVIENAPVMIAWLAMMVANVASSTIGQIAQLLIKGGMMPKNGLSGSLPPACPISAADWPA